MDLPKVQTVEEARDRIRLIGLRATEGPGGASDCHEMQDDLWADVLEAIAGGYLSAKQACELAKVALETGGIDFPRWYS